ncbi:MAG: bifunctional DNA primase/polymerase [Desulfobaccales bacterium]
MVKQKDRDEQIKQAQKPGRTFKAGIREEEVCQIFNLKKNLDYSDILIKYAHKYLTLGWDLVAVNAQGEAALDLDFRLPEDVWASRLTAMGLEGIQVNIGVRTGKPSRLLVLEIHREESLAPFNQPGEWCSGCVAEVGTSREQHYYVVPRGWQPPPSYFLESFQIMIFGEEGMVLAPPSLEPKAKAALRWLRPPWETPPTRPSPALCKFVKESAPSLLGPPLLSTPQVPTWAEIYPSINTYPSVLQALLAPAATPEEYYQSLVAAARKVGLLDPQVLLGILWHAPLGDGSRSPERWKYFQRLVGAWDRQEWQALPQDSWPTGTGVSADGGLDDLRDSETAAGEAPVGQWPPGGYPTVPAGAPTRSQGRGLKTSAPPGSPNRSRPSEEDYFDSWAEFFRLGRDTLLVDRRRYEAMIYELGKLGAWQDFLKGQHRENRQLREKIEAQWNRELEYFRQLSTKNGKKGWRVW